MNELPMNIDELARRYDVEATALARLLATAAEAAGPSDRRLEPIRHQGVDVWFPRETDRWFLWWIRTESNVTQRELGEGLNEPVTQGSVTAWESTGIPARRYDELAPEKLRPLMARIMAGKVNQGEENAA